MAEKGQLIALEGTGGVSMAKAARQLQRLLRQGRVKCGISKWDASAVFHEIREGARGIPGASPRALALLYASDLAFRLRWEIMPAIDSGITVIAAPYIVTAITFGRAAGIPRPWLRDLFEFAPVPDAIYLAPENASKAAKKPQPSDSYLEFGLAQLRNTKARWNTEEIRREFLTHLAGLESRGKACQVNDDMLARAATV